VVRVELADSRKKLILESGEEIGCQSLIICTGARPNKLGIPGEEKFTGRGVSYCATCDGPFFRDQEIIVVGGGDADPGGDVLFRGAPEGTNLLWDASADKLVVTGASAPALKIAGLGSLSSAAFAANGPAWADGGLPTFIADQKFIKIDVGGTTYRIPIWADA